MGICKSSSEPDQKEYKQICIYCKYDTINFVKKNLMEQIGFVGWDGSEENLKSSNILNKDDMGLFRIFQARGWSF